MTVQILRDLHGPAKAGIAVLILILILAVCLAFDINLAVLITPFIVGFAVLVVALVVVMYCALRWIRIQEQLAAQKTTDISDMQQGITALKQSVDSMQKKLD
ncbi:MAG: hypothetical protein PHD55_03405, partial [Methanoregula sp.]|nr:hypothetical protein [Methanoregula sp.]